MKSILKQYIIVFTIIFLNISSLMKSQIVVDYASDSPLPSNWDETGNYYLKDVNNYLDNFTGTWEYVNGNEKFQIILTKIIKYHTLSSHLNLNYYEDGIVFRYKKYVNNNLVFESPIESYPTFNTEDGKILKGMSSDYERVTKTINLGGGLIFEGGGHFPLSCHIEKLLINLSNNEPQKIKFKFYLGHFGESSGFGEYNNPIYAGQPFFSIPDDIIMTKVP